MNVQYIIHGGTERSNHHWSQKTVPQKPFLYTEVTHATYASCGTAGFYAQNIPARGRQAQREPTINDTLAILTYQRGIRLVTITINLGKTGTRINITAGKMQEFP